MKWIGAFVAFLVLGFSTGTQYSVPERVFTRDLYLGSCDDPMIRQEAEVYLEFRDLAVIGWSQDGKIAYVTWKDSSDGYGPCADLKVVVQSLVSDKILWSYDFFDDYSGAFEEVWKAQYPNFYRKLQEYGIVEHDTPLRSFPAEYDRWTVTCEVETIEGNQEYGDYDIDYELRAVSPGRGVKVIHSGNGVQGLQQAVVYGYLRSPYEDRIAVVLLEIYRGWEGPPSPVEPVIVGCNLKSGFQG